MIDFKDKIAEIISEATNIDKKQLRSYIEVPKDSANGDYAFPCFKLSKDLKKAPQLIAQDIKNNIKINTKILNKVEVVGGYLNFYINNHTLAKEVLTCFWGRTQKTG